MTNTEILEAAFRSHEPKMPDRVFDLIPLFARLKAKNHIKPFSGGRSIPEKLTVRHKSIPPEIKAEYGLSQAISSITISHLELVQNDEEALIDLVDCRMNILKGSMVNLMSESVVGDGTRVDPPSLTGLCALIPTTPDLGMAGGIDRKKHKWWRNVAHTIHVDSISEKNIVPAMNEVYDECTNRGGNIDLIIASEDLYSCIHKEKDGVTYSSVTYKGVEIAVEPRMKPRCMFFLDTDHLWLRYHKNRNMIMIFIDTNDLPEDVAFGTSVVWLGNLTASNLFVQGVLSVELSE